jgi:serine/threonine protein phosphatase 1
MRNYAIGDVHGHLDKLIAAHALIAADRTAVGDADAPVIHVGDLVDRGPDSRGVVQHLLGGVMRGERWVVLKGNHDQLFVDFLSEPQVRDPRLQGGAIWLDDNLGGAATLASYGVKNAGARPLDEVRAEAFERVPSAHLEFLAGRPLWQLWGQALFVHAGVRPGVEIQDQSKDDLLWIREAFLDDPSDHGALVVHGHTPVDAATHYGNRVNLDSGAAFGGPLSAVVIEDGEVSLLTAGGRVPLTPAT